MLTHSVSLYVPTTSYNVPAPESLVDSVKSAVLQSFCKLFGGATITIGEGAYLAESGEVIIEKVYICKSYTDDIRPDDLNQVRELAARIKLELNQESVSLEVDNTLDFI